MKYIDLIEWERQKLEVLLIEDLWILMLGEEGQCHCINYLQQKNIKTQQKHTKTQQNTLHKFTKTNKPLKTHLNMQKIKKIKT